MNKQELMATLGITGDVNQRYYTVEVSPTMAQVWLNLSPGNRKLLKKDIAKHSDSMKAGNWRLNGEAIKFDNEGGLADGHHRLYAVIDSGVTVKFDVFIDLLPDDKVTIDSGRSRNDSDSLFFHGHTDIDKARLATLKVFVKAPNTNNSVSWDRQLLGELWTAYKEPIMYAEIGMSKPFNQSALLAAIARAEYHGIDMDELDEFKKGFAKNPNDVPEDERYDCLRVLRESFLGGDCRGYAGQSKAYRMSQWGLDSFMNRKPFREEISIEEDLYPIKEEFQIKQRNHRMTKVMTEVEDITDEDSELESAAR